MKKLLVIAFGLFLTLAGCSSSGSSAPVAPVVPAQSTFMIDGKTFIVAAQPTAIRDLKGPITINNTPYIRSTLLIVGLNGSTEVGQISFDVYYKVGQNFGGTYQFYNALSPNTTPFYDTLLTTNSGCFSWMTSASINVMGSTTPAPLFNNPIGSVTLTPNSPTNYSIAYSGNFRSYNTTNLAFIRNVPVSINLTGDVTVQTF